MIMNKDGKDDQPYHMPVLLKSVNGIVSMDGTYHERYIRRSKFHSREILSRLMKADVLLDSTKDFEDAERNIVNDTHFIFVRSNFRYHASCVIRHQTGRRDPGRPRRILSFDDSERTASFRFDGALDMRMNKRAGDSRSS